MALVQTSPATARLSLFGLKGHKANPLANPNEVTVYNGYEDDPEHWGEDRTYLDWLDEEFWRAQVSDLAKQRIARGFRMQERYPSTYRTKFLPELKDLIVGNLRKQGVDELQVAQALKQWEKGEPPRTPTENGCFEVFDTIQKDIDKGR